MFWTSPGITCRSLAHAPRSINLQRSLQNGRHGDAAFHSTGRLQVGQGDAIATVAAIGSDARRQQERHVLIGLRRTHRHIGPFQEANRTAMMTAADLRKQLAAGRQRDAQQLALHVFIEHQLIHAARCGLASRMGVLAREP